MQHPNTMAWFKQYLFAIKQPEYKYYNNRLYIYIGVKNDLGQ